MRSLPHRRFPSSSTLVEWTAYVCVCVCVCAIVEVGVVKTKAHLCKRTIVSASRCAGLIVEIDSIRISSTAGETTPPSREAASKGRVLCTENRRRTLLVTSNDHRRYLKRHTSRTGDVIIHDITDNTVHLRYACATSL